MMKDVMRINMELEETETSIGVLFGYSIREDIDDILNKSEKTEIDKLMEKTCKVFRSAIKRSVEKEIGIKEEKEEDRINNLLDKATDALYEKLSDEEKRDVDEFRKELDKCSTVEEALMLTLNACIK